MLAHSLWFSPGTPASSTTKTGCHDIAKILLKVALNNKSNQINAKCILYIKIVSLVVLHRSFKWLNQKVYYIHLFKKKNIYIYIYSEYCLNWTLNPVNCAPMSEFYAFCLLCNISNQYTCLFKKNPNMFGLERTGRPPSITRS